MCAKKDTESTVYIVNSFQIYPKIIEKCVVYTVNSFKMLTKNE